MVWLAGTATAAPLNTWGLAQPSGTLSLTPWAYGTPDGYVAPTLYAGVGMPHGDLWGGFGIVSDADRNQSLSVELFPRFFPASVIGIGPHLVHTLGTEELVAGLEVDNVLHAGPFWWTTNLGWRPIISRSGLDLGTVFAYTAPELTVGRVSLSGEVDAVADPEDLTSVRVSMGPAVTLQVDRAATQFATFGVNVPVYPAAGDWVYGGWLAITLDPRRRSTVATSTEE